MITDTGLVIGLLSGNPTAKCNVLLTGQFAELYATVSLNLSYRVSMEILMGIRGLVFC